jgi:RNA polymerase sigma factor (sigma-70 family)
MIQSQKLLEDFIERRSEAAFGELVSEYIDMVYSVAARVTGDRHFAEDVSQTVFLDLARMAAGLPKNVLLGGWLHRHTCYVACTFMRSERRRQAREKKAMEMNSIQDHTEANLARLKPILDNVINELDSKDRNALVLRFFDQCEFAAVGQALGSSEEAARKRVNRALEKARRLLAKRGFAMSSASLVSTLTVEAATTAPTGLGIQITSATLTTIVPAPLVTAKLLLMTTTKTKALIAAILIAGIATPVVIQLEANRTLLTGNRLLREKLDQALHSRPVTSRQAPSVMGRSARVQASTQPYPSFNWGKIESTDYKQYAANLKAIGCPPETISDIVSQDLRKNFARRRWEFLKTTVSREFWKSDFQPSSGMDREKLLRLKEMDDEFNWTYKEILGTADPEVHFVQNIDTLDHEIVASYGDIDLTTFEVIKGHIKDFRTKLHLLSSDGSGNSELQQELAAQIASELTPEQLEDYEVRCSEPAKQLRKAIPKESPLTEQEFRAAYRSLQEMVGAASPYSISSNYINQALMAAVSK